MRVLLAPDKFKGCLTAAEVAAAVAAGLTDVRPDAGDRSCCRSPTAATARSPPRCSAGYRPRSSVDAVGPTGEPVRPRTRSDGQRAVVELAAVVGLDLLPGGQLDPAGRLDLRARAGDQGRHRPRRDRDRARPGRQRLDRRRRRDGPGARRPAARRRRATSCGRGGGALADAGQRRPGPAARRRWVGQDHRGDRRGQPAARVPTAPPPSSDRRRAPARTDARDRWNAAWPHWAEVVSEATGARRRPTARAPGAAGGTGFAALALLGRRDPTRASS